MPFPPHGERRLFPGVVAATAAVIRWRCEQLGLWADERGAPTPVIDAMFSRDEPHTGPSGTLAWAVDIATRQRRGSSPLTLKEVLLPRPGRHGVTRARARSASRATTRARSMAWRALLSLDMRVHRPGVDRHEAAQAAQLRRAARPLHGLRAGPAAGERRQQTWPSTVAYMARLVIHRYAMLGVLDEEGFPLREMGVLQSPAQEAAPRLAPMAGSRCPECGNATLIHKDGCEFCTACGHLGACG